MFNLYGFNKTDSSADVMERRGSERRHSVESLPSRFRSLPFLRWAGMVLLTLGLWKWRYVVNAPIWAVRAQAADRSDLYKGKTNGIPNRELVQTARSYLLQINQFDASGNILKADTFQGLGIPLNVSWFVKHHPEVVDYNPFLPSGTGPFLISWQYAPGCQKTLHKSLRSDTDWYDLQGLPCFGAYVNVRMDSSLKLMAMEAHRIPH